MIQTNILKPLRIFCTCTLVYSTHGHANQISNMSIIGEVVLNTDYFNCVFQENGH